MSHHGAIGQLPCMPSRAWSPGGYELRAQTRPNRPDIGAVSLHGVDDAVGEVQEGDPLPVGRPGGSVLDDIRSLGDIDLTGPVGLDQPDVAVSLVGDLLPVWTPV